ncbi:MAG: FHA domain-containing protein [Clostridiales bacterium]|nr:FHA domain-containing protein [Clostridiales bacterium]
MSSTEFEFIPGGLSGRRYMIHLKNEDEVCLHALSILQADLLPCYLPAQLSSDHEQLIFDLADCIPLQELNGNDLHYVRRHGAALLRDFLLEIVHSLHFAMDLNGLVYSRDNLFYNRKTRKLVCIYLPLLSRLWGKTALLSGCDEHGMDTLLQFGYEKKWITSSAMDRLYAFFRSDDERSAEAFIRDDLIEESRSLPSPIRILLFLWFILFLSYLFCSVFIEHSFSGTIWAAAPGFLFFFNTASMITVLLLHMDRNKQEHKMTSEEKEKRRKSRNARMLFPGNEVQETMLPHFSFASCPVQFIGLSSECDLPNNFTMWTHRLIIGRDADMCDYCIDHASLALIHAEFSHDDSGFYIEPLQEGKGTFRNRQRLAAHEKAYLQDGDIVGMGDLEFKTHFVHTATKKKEQVSTAD